MSQDETTDARTRVRTNGERFYGERLTEFGPTAQGVGWNSVPAQELRFAELIKVCDGAKGPFSINDYGCGYGSLHPYLQRAGVTGSYTGFDLNPGMVAEAAAQHSGPEVRFTTDESELEPADFTFASGLFGNRFGVPADEWHSYVLDTIDRLAGLSTQGFAFNMLTSHSDPDRMRAELYYADPGFFFEHCMDRYSRRVALLHHYELFDFTILVVLNDRRPPRSEAR